MILKLATVLSLVFASISEVTASQQPANSFKPTKSGLYNAGGFELYLECYENENPLLILEQGFGRSGSDGVWLENIKNLQDEYSVCLYDRAGLGKSEKGPVPFTVNDMASRLKTLLTSAKLKSPYYFAGGSYASYIISAYNNQYPEDVRGALFIDPPPFGYFYTMGTRWPKDFKSENENLQRMYQFEQSVYDPMFKRVPENVDHMASYQQLKSANGFGNKPIIVVRAAKSDKRYDPPFVPTEIANKMDSLYANAERGFMSLSKNVSIVYSESPKHHLHIADRELVVEQLKLLKQR